jgi:hypothetical protein
MELLETALRPAGPEAQLLGLRADDTCFGCYEQFPVVVVQQHRAAVVRAVARSFAASLMADEPRHALRFAEQHVDLIYQVGAEVVDGAVAGSVFEFPRVRWGVWTVAVEVRGELCDFSQRTGGEDLLEGDKVTVISSVLVDSELFAGFLRDGAELVCFGSGGDKGLLDDNVFTCLESGLAHGEVGFGDAGDNYEIYGAVAKDLVDAAIGFSTGMVSFGVVVGFR